MDIISALILGIVQGFTEWLPISSSGHLVIAHEIFGIEKNAEFDIMLMLGTTAALVIYFREKILWILKGLISFSPPSLQYIKMIILAGIPTAILAFFGRTFFKTLFYEPIIVSLLIFATGVFLFFASRAKNIGKKIKSKSAILVGIAQGLASSPGISRSGSTIGTALLMGIEPREAAEFSFIIGIPAMSIASILEFAQAPPGMLGADIIIAGLLASFAAGYLSIGFFMEILKRGKFSYFAYYCILAGLMLSLAIFLLGK
ncbi:MAG: undecaprenyl-diphosphate phosphatase [Candidatus Micrarchaeota archaeon]